MSMQEPQIDPQTNSAPQGDVTELPPTAEPGVGGTLDAKTSDPVLVDELREFGRQIEGLFQTARSSTRGKELEAQLTQAWRDVEKGVNDAIAKAQSSDIKGTVQGTTQYAADEVQSGLARGLKGINTWMAQKRADAEDRRKKREAAISSAAVSGSADNDVGDRFGGDQPSFNANITLPGIPLPQAPDAGAANKDNPIADRFDEEIKL